MILSQVHGEQADPLWRPHCVARDSNVTGAESSHGLGLGRQPLEILGWLPRSFHFYPLRT